MKKENWEVKRLGDVCDSVNGLWKGKKAPFKRVGVIRNTNFTKDCRIDTTNIEYLDVEEKQYRTRKLFYGDLILEKSGGGPKQPVGRVIPFEIEQGEYSFSNFTALLRVKEKNKLNYRFLYLCLFHFYKSGKTESLQSNTTGIRNLDFNAYKLLKILMPPLTTQEQIVKELDTLSDIIAKKKAQLAELDTLAQATFYGMFGDPVENEKGWDVKRIKEVCSKIYGGGTPSKNISSYYEDGTILWVTPKDMKYKYISDSQIKITTQGLSNSSVKLIPIGAILMVLRSGILKHTLPVAIAKKELTVNQDLKAFICNSCISNIYMHGCLKAFEDYLLTNVRAVTADNIEFSIIKNLKIPIPPLSLQNQFAQRIEAIEQQKVLIQQSIDDVQQLFDYTMDKYFN